MADDIIRYDVLATEALRGVVRKVLSEVAKTGLPGEHHFFISFDTRHPAVRISSALKARYPQEITIVLQHLFWDLEVHDNAFEIGLSFFGAAEKLYVPFAAITGFTDPHVEFSLRFETVVDDEDENTITEHTQILNNDNEDHADVKPHLKPVPETHHVPELKTKEDKEKKISAEPKKIKKPKSANTDGDDDHEQKTADVVSLDAFRKKDSD